MHFSPRPPSQPARLHPRDGVLTPSCLLLQRRGKTDESGSQGPEHRLYLGCGDVLPCQITFKFNSSHASLKCSGMT